MGLGKCCVLVFVLALATCPAFPQTQSSGAVRTPLATGRLVSVVDMPLYFRLYAIRLPAAQHGLYKGSNAMLYDLSGASAIEIDGVAQRLAAGAGVFISAGQAATIKASAAEPANLLMFVLTARPNQRGVLIDRSAAVRELYRTPDPLPGLRAGPYEFSLTRVTLPAGERANPPPYYRSGAALDYVLAGTAFLTADGKIEATPAEKPLFERFGWVHRLANLGDRPLVLIQANINREGEPAVHIVAEN